MMLKKFQTTYRHVKQDQEKLVFFLSYTKALLIQNVLQKNSISLGAQQSSMQMEQL